MLSPVVSASQRTIVIFDLGGVLIDWNPRHLFRKIFEGDEAGMEHFLAHVCNQAWNEKQDEGRSFAEAVQEAINRHPDKEPYIRAYHERWVETLGGPLHETVEVLTALHDRQVPLYALTNWSAETYPHAQRLFSFLAHFKGVVVSGTEKLIKPDPRIYRLLLERYDVAPESAVYIDDNSRNAEAATKLGLHGIHFTGAAALRDELVKLDLLPAA
ncbi:MAG TPA: HAD family phosphatase [Magnetospirillaceae bacterium]|jgi:2-haloacid dehalogenase